MEKKYLTVKELAEALGKTENNIRVQIHKKKILPAARNPNRYDISEFQKKNVRAAEKIKRLQKRIIALKARLAEREKTLHTLLGALKKENVDNFYINDIN